MTFYFLVVYEMNFGQVEFNFKTSCWAAMITVTRLDVPGFVESLGCKMSVRVILTVKYI